MTFKNKEYAAEYYKNNKERLKKQREDFLILYPEKKRERYQNYYAKQRAWFEEIKNSLFCIECGESRNECLDFHHINPQEKDIAVSIISSRSKKRILEEIKKCIVLCSNCHRVLHKKLKEQKNAKS